MKCLESPALPLRAGWARVAVYAVYYLPFWEETTVSHVT